MISAAPVSFVTAVLMGVGACSIAIWFAINWAYSARLSSKDGEIQLLTRQRDDYKEKLGGATPDEAKKRIIDLETKVARLDGRHLTPKQREILSSRAVIDISYRLAIGFEAGCFDCRQYAEEFAAVFRALGYWQVSIFQSEPINPTSSELLMEIFTEELTDTDRKFSSALDDAGLKHEIIKSGTASVAMRRIGMRLYIAAKRN